MAAATITTEGEAAMAYDHVVLTLSDGETYVSRMSKPLGAILTEAETTVAALGSAMNLDYALSGRTFTIRYKQGAAAVTDKKVSMLIWGKL